MSCSNKGSCGAQLFFKTIWHKYEGSLGSRRIMRVWRVRVLSVYRLLMIISISTVCYSHRVKIFLHWESNIYFSVRHVFFSQIGSWYFKVFLVNTSKTLHFTSYFCSVKSGLNQYGIPACFRAIGPPTIWSTHQASIILGLSGCFGKNPCWPRVKAWKKFILNGHLSPYKPALFGWVRPKTLELALLCFLTCLIAQK